MQRLILVLAFITVCWSASAQYIKEDFELAGVRSITGMPCIQNQDYQQYLINYKYLAKEGTKYMLLELVCLRQDSAWIVSGGSSALIKLLGGGLQSMTATDSEFGSDKSTIKVAFALAEDFDKQGLGITDIMFRTSFGSPANIKIHLDEKCQEHLHKSYLEIMARAGL